MNENPIYTFKKDALTTNVYYNLEDKKGIEDLHLQPGAILANARLEGELGNVEIKLMGINAFPLEECNDIAVITCFPGDNSFYANLLMEDEKFQHLDIFGKSAPEVAIETIRKLTEADEIVADNSPLAKSIISHRDEGLLAVSCINISQEMDKPYVAE